VGANGECPSTSYSRTLRVASSLRQAVGPTRRAAGKHGSGGWRCRQHGTPEYITIDRRWRPRGQRRRATLCMGAAAADIKRVHVGIRSLDVIHRRRRPGHNCLMTDDWRRLLPRSPLTVNWFCRHARSLSRGYSLLNLRLTIKTKPRHLIVGRSRLGEISPIGLLLKSAGGQKWTLDDDLLLPWNIGLHAFGLRFTSCWRFFVEKNLRATLFDHCFRRYSKEYKWPPLGQCLWVRTLTAAARGRRSIAISLIGRSRPS